MPFPVETVKDKRKRVTLAPGLEKRLASYALTCAAGLAFPFGSAQAAIDYTLVKTTGGPGSTVDIDLNQDGVIDFSIKDYAYGSLSGHFGLLLGTALDNNAIAGSYGDVARALSAGQEIGPSIKFQHIQSGMQMANVSRMESGAMNGGGGFLHQSNRFLGLRFSFQGNTYYGWARVDTISKNGQINFELVDYAYQTKPNTPIQAGAGIKRSSPSDASSLGALAFGSPALQVKLERGREFGLRSLKSAD